LQEELQQKALERIQMECPFRPQINTTEYVQHLNEYESVEERLLQRGRQIAASREEQRLRKLQDEQAELRRLFRPQVNPNDPYKRALMHPPNLPVEERLLHYGKTVEESRKQLKEDKETFERKQLLEFFRPSTGSSGGKKQRSFLTRAETRQNDRDKAVTEARSQLMREYTFQPSISKLSAELVQEQRRGRKGVDRARELHAEAIKRRQERERKEREQAAMEADRKAYQPTTNPVSDQWIHSGMHSKLFEQDFVTRQKQYDAVHKEHEEKLRKALDSTAGNAEKTSRKVSKEEAEAHVERLYAEYADVSREFKARLAEQLQREECPFTPATCIGTEHVIRRILREKDVYKRLFSPQQNNRAHSADAARVIEHSNASIPTSRTVHPREAEEFYSRQIDALHRKEQELHHRSAAEQLKSHAECTFRPRTTVDDYYRLKEHDQKRKLKDLHGVNTFMRRQEEARKLQQAKEERLKQLGKGMPCNGPNFTVVTPFKLSEGRHAHQESNPHPYDIARSEAKSTLLQQPRQAIIRSQNTSTFGVESRLGASGHHDPYNSEKLLAALRKYSTN
jgi:hypothetical protein